MHKLDFISGAPKTFIFQNSSNKTNLGGLLTFIFCFIIIAVIYYYLYEYFANPKYKVSYTYDDEYFSDVERMYGNRTLYPDLNFNISIEPSIIQKDIKIINNIDEEIPIGYNYSKHIPELSLQILYKCIKINETINKTITEKIDCKLRDDDIDEYNSDLFYLNDLKINFTGFYNDHQNPKSPLKRGADYENFLFTINGNIDYYKFNWKIIKYEEEKSFSGIFGGPNIFYGGYFTRSTYFSIPEQPPFEHPKRSGDYYKLVSVLHFEKNNFAYYETYVREKVSIFDAIANICSLIITLYGIITFIFCQFYSNSFDNYKIVEKIISNNTNLHKRMPSSFIETGIGLINEMKSIKKDDLLNENDDNTKNIIIKNDNIKDIEEEEDDDDCESNMELKLNKFHFYDFFYNNIYSEKCCRSPIQGIIKTCNELISKYYSVDSIVYNQIRLENLFKDYKWNNIKLKNIDNNAYLFLIKYLSGY